jgi:hypothetical protein
MQKKINNQERGNMTRVRMNTELRNKLFNKIKDVFENEDTQEKEDYLQAREKLIVHTRVQVFLQKKLLREHIHQKMLQY